MRNPQKSSPSASRDSRMIASVNALVTQGMIRLSGPSQLLRRQAAEPPHVGGVDGRQDLLEDLQRFIAAPPTRRGRGADTWR